MPGFCDTSSQCHLDFEDFERIIDDEQRNGFYLLTVDYLNAEHLVYEQPDSQLPHSAMFLITNLLDEYMPMGILSIDQVIAADDILKEIKNQNYANIDLSKQYFQMIPHRGNLLRLKPIDNEQKYKSNVEFLNRLRSVIESMNKGLRSSLNPIDYFTRYWLRVELHEIGRSSLNRLLI